MLTNGLVWLETGTSGGYFEYDNEISDYVSGKILS